MKKLLTILILLLAVASQGRADNPEIVIWEGNEPISWNPEVYQGSQYELIPAIDLKKDDIIKITTTTDIDSPQYVLAYKAGSGWTWTNLTITTDNDIMSYTVESEQIATEIKRGLIFRGQGYNITKVSVIRPLNAESGATVDGNKINVDNFKITSAAALEELHSVQLLLNENDNVKGDMLTIKLASTSLVELNVSYYGTDTQGPKISLTPGNTPAEVNLPLDGNKTINKIEIKPSAANQEITLSEISIASAKEVFKPNETLTLDASTDTKGQSVSYYKFGNASSGDKILVYVAGSNVSMDMKAGGDNPLRGHTWDSSINQTSSISESSSVQRVFVYELTEGNRLNYIKDHGFYIEVTSGSCTLDKIMLMSDGDIPTSEPNIFDGNGKADISRASTDGEGTYNFSSETGLNIAASAGKGITLNTVTGETVNRKELAISLDKAIPVTVQYTIGGESKTAILNAKDINLTLDESKALTQVSIKPVNTTTGDGSVTVKNVAVLSTSSASTASNKDELWAGSRAITAEYGIPYNYKYDRLVAGDVIRVTCSGDGDLNAAISYSTDGSAKTSISSLIADLEAKTLEFAVTSDMLEAIKTYGLYISGNLTLSKVERITASTIPAESALEDGETRVLWKSQAGEAIDYSVLFTVGSALAGIIVKNEQILVSVSSIETGDGKYNKVWACSLSDINTQLISEQHLENASGTLALTITADKLESLRSGFGIAADDMTITEVSLRKPRLIDSFTGYTNAEAHTMTAKQWNGGITLDYGTDSDESAAYLTVETSENSVLKHEITFTDGWVYEYYDSEATKSRTIALDGTKKIQKIFLQNANSADASTEGTVTFSNIALSSTTSGSAVTPSTKKALTNTASITEVNTKAGRLVVNLTNALATTVKIGYDDETVVLYPVNNTANRNLALDATKTISTIDIVKADDSETALAISENNIYLQMTSVEGDEAAITKPTTDANTTLFAPSAGVAMSGNKICLVSAVYVTNLLEAGQEMNVTLSKSENPVLKLLNESGGEVKSYNLKDLQGGVARIPVTATLLSSIVNGFSLSGSDITISNVDIFKPATQGAPTTENSLTLYSKNNPEMTSYDDICYVNSGYGAVFEEDMELRITVTEISSGTEDYRKVLIHDANSMEQLGAGFAEVGAIGDVVFTLTAVDVEAMKNGFCVLAQNLKVSKIVLVKSAKTEKTLKEMTEAVAIGDGDITINHGLFANAEVGDVIRIYGGSFGAESKVAIKIGETENCLDGAGWPSFTSSPFSLTLTESVLAVVKAQDIRISGQDYSFSKATLLTSQNLGGNIYKLTTEATNGSITVKKNNAVTEETFFDENIELSLESVAATNFEFEKWTIGGAPSTDNPLSLTMDADKVVTAHFKPKGLAENETRNLHTSSGDVIDWNHPICEKGASYGALLQAGDVFQITVSALTSGTDDHQVVLRGGSHDEGTSVKATGMVEIVVTADILSNYTSGFSITGTGVTISKVDLFRPKAVSRTERMMNESEVVMDGSNGATVNSGRFANASAYDVLRVYFTNTSGATSTSADEDKMHLILKYNGESDNWDYIKEMRFAGNETQFEIPLTQSVLALLKKNGLQITGSGYTFKSVSIKTAGEVPSDGEDDISNDASEEAKKVYNVLKDLYGKKIVSGVVANVDWNTKEAENVYGWTGKYPAMNVYDYINLHASKDVNSAGWVDYSDITTAKNWWKEGGIVGAMWHWQVKANNRTDYTCTPGTAANETSFDASKVYLDGTDENTLAKQQLDQLCGYLKKMQDAGIPVVWRPLHEASGNVEQNSGGKAWFWWGAKGADVYKQLWQWMYNYMVKTKGLNNLIWVWTSQTEDNNWYPGDAYVDIIGRDNYGATAATLATEYEALKAAYPNKMITLSECGNSESTEMAKLSSIWDAGSRWSWFMTWYDGDYNDGKTTTHKHTSEAWWEDAVSKDYVITRDKMKELLGQESSDDSKTGVNISLDDLNEGWSSSYNATTKTITTEGEWAARGWYIGDNRYNSKGSVTVKFEAVNFGVTLKMEYTNTGGESKSVSAGAAAGETGVELDIPADIKTMDKVYITYQPIGTLKLTAAKVNDKVVDNRTEKTLVEKSQAISDGDIAINRGLFSNAVAGDVLRVYADGLSESSKLALEPGDYSGAFDGANWTGFTESPFKLKLTATLIATIKEKGLLIRGESFTFKKAVLYTEKELGSEISDEEKKGDEEKDDEEKIIDKKTGEADLTVLSAQDDTKTTLTQNEDGSITMTTTEPYCAAQIWFNDPEPVAGNVLKVELVESKVNVTITVQYTDGTQSQMSANTSGVATARAATRGDSDPGTTIEVPLETGKEVQNIEVKNNVAGTITIKKMQVTTINIFTNGVANLSMLKPQSNATYDTSTHTLATTKGWTGATISPVGGENVSGKELLIEFADASKVKVAVKYRTDVEGPSTIMEKAAKAVRLALDNTKNIQEISIQPTEASIVTFKKIAVNSEESDDGTLKPGKTITLWESAAGETLSWNEVAKQDASVGDMLQEYDELLITISGVTEGCDWPKVFIRDASSEQAGNEVLLNDVGSFPYTVRIVLTGEMAQQLQKGFSICGDGVTVTKLQVYRPEAPKTGDIHLADLNYGYNSSYDKGTHTITTTARWAARGWEIGDKRYNDKNLITVKFEPVDFPVTLKMEYTTGLQTAQATSVGVPAGRTELLLEIPSGISKLNRVYIIYENPGSVKLTEASVTYQDKLKLSTAIEAFEAEGVIRDGRYDTDGWYNLRGMRIAEPKTSGIYIHGGKKVVIY